MLRNFLQPSVFISYSHRDAAAHELVLASLLAHKCTVWWDEKLAPGKRWGAQINAELGRCDAVVVLWSRTAVESTWVKHEASIADSRSSLIPIQIDDCNIPNEFANLHTPKLSVEMEQRDAANRQLDLLFAEVQALNRNRLIKRLLWVAFSLALVAGLALFAAAQACRMQALLNDRWIFANCLPTGNLLSLGRMVGRLEGLMMPEMNRKEQVDGLLDNLKHVNVKDCGPINTFRLQTTHYNQTALNEAISNLSTVLQAHSFKLAESPSHCTAN